MINESIGNINITALAIFATSTLLGIACGWIIGQKISQRMLAETEQKLERAKAIIEEKVQPIPSDAVHLINQSIWQLRVIRKNQEAEEPEENEVIGPKPP